MTVSFTLPLDTLDNHIENIGGKGRSLSRLINAGFDVPGGFHIPISAYRGFVARHQLQDRILELARPAFREGGLSFEEAATSISTLFSEHELSAEELAAIRAACEAFPGDPPVAVRSSANAEDLPDLSFAGQQETYLNVSGAAKVAEAVKKCWASLWTAQAMNYRQEMGIDHVAVAMAVVVQQMVPSEVSGIAFTANPVNGNRSEMIINSSFGLGEAVVSGQVSPDTYVVDRESLAAIETTLGDKAKQIVADGAQGVRMMDVSGEQRVAASLSAESLRELADLALRVEQTFDGVPQDIEWALVGGRFRVLQARPITNLPDDPLKDVEWPEITGAQLYKRMASEVMPEPLSPLFEDLYLKGLYDTQTWPKDWQWRGSNTRNYLSNFIIATVNGYAFQAIYIDQGEESRVHWARVRQERGTLAWHAAIKAVFFPPRASKAATEKVDVNNANAAGRMMLLMEIRDSPMRWVWVLYHWWRAFAKADAVTRWQRVDLPSYLAKLDRWRGLQPAGASDEALLEGVRALTLAEARYWHVLRGIIGAAKASDQALQNFLKQNAPGLGLSSGIFLSGFHSRTLEAEAEMCAIAATIRNRRPLYELTLTTPAKKLLEALRAHPDGTEVVGAINDYLNEYGKQLFNLDFVEPALIEEPLPFLTNLRAMVRHAGSDLGARQKQVARKRRDKWFQAIRFFATRRLETASSSPYEATVSRSALLEFLRLYRTAKINYPTREEAIFYMGAAWSLLRPFALELGRRMADAGSLATAGDVFYLTGDELEQVVSAGIKDRPMPELIRLAESRRALRQQRKRMQQPAAIPGENKLAWLKGGGKSFDTIKVNEDNAGVISGFAVSPGTVTGTVSLVMSPEEFDRMQPDTILVCPLTTPAWTQLFPYATGLVTDIGSITAHGSIVAREYGIPAVLGTGNGTRLIKHGQTITVDGDNGIVTIVEDE